MGRAKKSEKSARSEDPEDKEPEPYQPNGHFHTDFAELCKEQELFAPSISLRPRRPSSPPHHEQSQAPTGKKGKEDKKLQQQLQQQQQEPEEETPEEKAVMELLGFKPKTFVVKNFLEMMRPSIQVEMENPDKQDSVTEVYIRDWKLQPQMLNTLGRCWEKLSKLHSIFLWRVAPDASLIHQLGDLLPQLQHLKSLSVECCANVDNQNFADLLRSDSSITKLQLRFNGINDRGASLIADQLYGLHDPASKLVSLDLSSNSIGDAGACALAKNLRTNRTLLHLSLSNNEIGDTGARALAEVCSRFFLTHEEIVERRKLMSVDRRNGSSVSVNLSDNGDQQSLGQNSIQAQSTISSNSNSHLSTEPPPSRKAADRPGSVRSVEKDKKATQKQAKGKKDEKGKADEKSKGKTQKDDPKAKGKGGNAADKENKNSAKTGKGRANRVKMSTPQLETEQQEEHFDSEHPLLERADSSYAPGHLLISGNYALALVNLSRNRVSDIGIASWKTCICYQQAYMQRFRVRGTGILKLMLEGNQFSKETENYKIMEDILNSRDPLRPGISD